MSGTKLHVVACMKARSDKVEELRELLESLVEPTHAEPGCVQYFLTQNRQDPAEFVFVEEWRDEAALEAHLDSPHLRGAKDRLGPLLAGDLVIRRLDRLHG